MKISIITPSFNMLSYLELCAASVADQKGVEYEHFVVDGASTDGTVEWLQSQRGIGFMSEKDNGMYDAINKGLRKTDGDIIGYLNCDEQYLPGTLAFVEDYFEKHPKVDFLFGGALLTRPDGSLIAFRKSYPARWPYIAASHLYLQSCSMFFRRWIIDDGHAFDDRCRLIGDEEFVVSLLRDDKKPGNVNRFLATFTMTGGNLSLKDNEDAKAEKMMIMHGIPKIVKKMKRLLTGLRWLEKFLRGGYSHGKPIEYEIYTPESKTRRQSFSAKRASSRWKWS